MRIRMPQNVSWNDVAVSPVPMPPTPPRPSKIPDAPPVMRPRRWPFGGDGYRDMPELPEDRAERVESERVSMRRDRAFFRWTGFVLLLVFIGSRFLSDITIAELQRRAETAEARATEAVVQGATWNLARASAVRRAEIAERGVDVMFNQTMRRYGEQWKLGDKRGMQIEDAGRPVETIDYVYSNTGGVFDWRRVRP